MRPSIISSRGCKNLYNNSFQTWTWKNAIIDNSSSFYSKQKLSSLGPWSHILNGKESQRVTQIS